VMIVLEDGHQFQVATFRAEEDYRDGRRPEKITFPFFSKRTIALSGPERLFVDRDLLAPFVLMYQGQAQRYFTRLPFQI